MYVIEQDAAVNAWIAARGGGRAAWGTFKAVGWETAGDLTAGLALHSCNGYNCYANIAVANPHSIAPLLKFGLPWAFDQLALPRLTFAVSSRNLPSISLVTGLGADHEATLYGAGDSGEDLLIFALRPVSCKLWNRIRGKNSRSSSVA